MIYSTPLTQAHMIYFDALTQADCEQIRKWRNLDIAGARTPYMLTELMQADFYRNDVSNRDSRNRWCAIRTEAFMWDGLIGIAGLTNIEQENGRGEIALMISPDLRGKGYGKCVFEKLKAWAFGMRLHTIYANVYTCNNYAAFWDKLGAEIRYVLPETKWHGEQWHATIYYQWSDNASIQAAE